MDLDETIRQLNVRKQKIELAITLLEQLQDANVSGSAVMPSLRGRKQMGSEERQQVSERMKRYWASRREQVKS